MTADTFFHNNPLFRREDFVNCKKKQGNVKLASITFALQYYVKKGRLLRVHQGLYAVVPPGEARENFYVDPYLLAAKSAKDSILSYHTALELHGYAYSTFGQFTFITSQKIKPFEYNDLWFQPVRMPAALKKQEMIEVEISNRQGVDIKVTDIERTFVDVIDRVELCGGWEEVCRSISAIAVLNVERVVNYCLSLNNSTLNAKVGYFLEKRKGVFTVPEETLSLLLKKTPRSAQYIADRHRERCYFVSKWNLMIPESVLRNTWEEPNYDV